MKKIKKISKAKLKKKEKAEKNKKWKELSKSIRDNIKCCQICNSKNNLQIHHILEKKYYPELYFENNNLICLCPKHHLFGAESAHRGAMAFIYLLKKICPEKYLFIKNYIKNKLGE